MTGYVNCHSHFKSSFNGHFKNSVNVKSGCAGKIKNSVKSGCAGKIKNSVKGGCAGKVKNSFKCGCAGKVKNRSLFDENGFFKFSRRYAACAKDKGGAGCRCGCRCSCRCL